MTTHEQSKRIVTIMTILKYWSQFIGLIWESMFLEEGINSLSRLLGIRLSPSELLCMQDVIIEDNGRGLVIPTTCAGSCAKVFQAVGVALPPTVREM